MGYNDIRERIFRLNIGYLKIWWWIMVNSSFPHENSYLEGVRGSAHIPTSPTLRFLSLLATSPPDP
jgi:hypothetical protein